VKVYVHTFLTSALDRDEWPVSLLWPLFHQRKNPRYLLERRLDGPKAGLDVVTKRKIADPARNRVLVDQPIASHYSE
jgi:hypothetical protein